MSCYVLCIALFLCPFFTAHASVVNGFQQEKLILANKIKYNKKLLKEDNDDKTNRQLEKNIKQLQKKYEIVIKSTHKLKNCSQQ